MKTLNEILDNYKDYAVVLDDRFGSRLAKFLTEEQLEKIGFKYDGDEPYPEPKEWTRENILEQLKSDVEFGFEKALDQRGISAGLMFYVVLRWNQVLEEGLENYPEENYAMYGLPLFKATAVKYGYPTYKKNLERVERRYGNGGIQNLKQGQISQTKSVNYRRQLI